MAEAIKRRDFVKVLGITGAGAAAAGCGTGDVDLLRPYVIQPEEIVPGIPTWYATTCRECPAGCGLHVETHEGRATKVEGNPDHPVSRGNTCARGQASVQGLYHPDRYRGPFLVEADVGGATRDVTWSVAEQQLALEIQRAPRGSVAFLTGSYGGGAMDRLVDDFVRAVGGRRVVWAPLEDAPRDLDFADADYLVSFGADFLETWGSPVDYAWQFARMHGYRKGGVRGKFVWVGPHRPLTGLNADQWVSCRPGTEALVAESLAGGASTADAARETGVPQAVLDQLAREWGAARRKLALGPGTALSGVNAAALRAAVARLNGSAAPAETDPRPLRQLIADMQAGRVRVLLVDAPNPAYTLPAGLGFAAAVQRVPVRVSFATFPDETSKLATMVLPDHHFLEAWGDYIPTAGVACLVQPAMRPVFNTKQVGDVLLSVARNLNLPLTAGVTATTFYDYLRAAWAALPGTEAAWRQALERGGLFAGGGVAPAVTTDPAAALAPGAAAGRATADTAVVPTEPAAPPPPRSAPVGSAAYAAPQWEGNGAFHLVVYPSYRFFDGRTANRPWLLELPDPVTKVPWGAWVEVHPDTAGRLEVKQGDYVRVRSPHGTLEGVPVYIWPGVREDTVAIQMGLGHDAFGRFTEGVGVNPMRLLGASALDPVTGTLAPYGVKVSLERTGGRHGRWDGIFENGVRVQYDRAIARAVSLAHLRAVDTPAVIPGADELVEQLHGHGGFTPVPTYTDPASGYPPAGTEYGEYIDVDTRWGMVVDLARCIGCGACVIACNAENNVPVVGPREMKRGRELSWLRIERYFGPSRDGEEAYQDAATDDVRFLPMLCQHCGNAPCEPVCPVYAAYHTPDGLNAQVYNRCVGTRYCANNCPYKVRVFNWFTYEFAEPLNWQLNPDVTVREKGVMEKCTFCVQRIHQVERVAAQENRPVVDGEVVPACVQTCPAEVFVFGDFSDLDSGVSRAARSNRAYRALEEINTQPAIVYLKKVTLHEPTNGGHHDERPAAVNGSESVPQRGH